ncbi:MAG: hypothetical protein R2939_18845 [Kofleriaceae bacterium]
MLNEASGQAVAAAMRSPMPKLTAYDVMLELNSKLPARDKVTLDVSELSISDGEVDRIITQGAPRRRSTRSPRSKGAQEVTCFSKIDSGDNSVGANGVRQFAFTIAATCM